jgi:hypothetical protein
MKITAIEAVSLNLNARREMALALSKFYQGSLKRPAPKTKNKKKQAVLQTASTVAMISPNTAPAISSSLPNPADPDGALTALSPDAAITAANPPLDKQAHFVNLYI